MSPPVLAFRKAAFGYTGRTVLCEIDFELRAGEFVGVLGPNGSGKTTMIRGATRMIEPLAGGVELNGRPLASHDRRALARSVAVVPQEGTPIFPFTVLETVLMGRAPWLRTFAFEGKEDVERARAALDAVGALDLEGRDLAELSGGERQRVVVARALAQGTNILLADEPTAHLDLRYAVAVFELLRRLRDERGLALLLVTHDVNLAAAHCDRLLLLADGTLRAHGTPAEVLRAEPLSRAFGTPLEVHSRPDGTPFVVPGVAPRRT